MPQIDGDEYPGLLLKKGLNADSTLMCQSAEMNLFTFTALAMETEKHLQNRKNRFWLSEYLNSKESHR